MAYSDPLEHHDLDLNSTDSFYPLSVEAMKAIDAIEYITDHLKYDEEYKMVILFMRKYFNENLKQIIY